MGVDGVKDSAIDFANDLNCLKWQIYTTKDMIWQDCLNFGKFKSDLSLIFGHFGVWSKSDFQNFGSDKVCKDTAKQKKVDLWFNQR